MCVCVSLIDHSGLLDTLLTQSFRKGNFRCLVATDVAARGLDIPEVDLVVQTESPSVRRRGMGGREKGRGGRGRGGRRETCSVIIVSYYVTLFLSPVLSGC